MKKQRGLIATLMIIGLAVAAIGGWLYLQQRKITQAELARDQAIVERDQTAVERDKAIGVAQENAATIAGLEAEKERTNQALNDLAAQKEVIRTNTITREVIIQGQATTAASTTTVAPVIADIISAVQADRVRRRGGQFIAPVNGTAGTAGSVTNGANANGTTAVVRE